MTHRIKKKKFLILSILVVNFGRSNAILLITIGCHSLSVQTWFPVKVWVVFTSTICSTTQGSTSASCECQMVRGPRDQRKSQPGKRGPKSWREMAVLPKGAGLPKRNQFRINMKKSKATMKRYRTFFRFIWKPKTAKRYCSRLKTLPPPNKGCWIY